MNVELTIFFEPSVSNNFDAVRADKLIALLKVFVVPVKVFEPASVGKSVSFKVELTTFFEPSVSNNFDAVRAGKLIALLNVLVVPVKVFATDLIAISVSV